MAKNKKQTKTIIFYVLLTLLALIWMAPVFTVFITALKSQGDFYSGESLFSLPEKLKWSNFAAAWTKGRMASYMKNGLIICLMKVPLGILIESMAAFALTRLNVKHKTGLFILL